MKKWMLLCLVVFQCQLFAQKTFNADSIPVVDGKVVFRVEFETDLDKKEVQDRMIKYLNEFHEPYSGEFIINNNDFTVCRIVDYIDISSGFLNTFAMYMTYNLSFEYSDTLCVLVIQNIVFMEKEYFEIKEEAKTFRTRELDMPEYSAEDIMIDGNYKVLMIPKASKKVTEASVEKINSIIEEINTFIYRKRF